ncbi:hypothetical protein I3843_02G133800 [Carya illinoinensis]|nr:hypothetical protein I3843_02G133800 [Carya illinoinensis]
MIVTSALIIWKALMCITGSESPVVVVLSESMEPGFKRGDILFLHMSKDPVRAGEIVVFNVDGRDIPIVHRVIKVHERQDTGEVDVLTKGDNNNKDDRVLYAHRQLWLQQHHIMGRAAGFLPYVGWVTIIMTEKPIIKTRQAIRNVTKSPPPLGDALSDEEHLLELYSYWCIGVARYNIERLKNEAISSRG